MRAFQKSKPRASLIDLGIEFRFIGYGDYQFAGGGKIDSYCDYGVKLTKFDEQGLMLLSIMHEFRIMDDRSLLCELADIAQRNRMSLTEAVMDWELDLSHPPFRTAVRKDAMTATRIMQV